MDGIIYIFCYSSVDFMAAMDKGKSNAQIKTLEPINARTAIKFFGLSVFVYCLLAAVWPIIGGVYLRFYLTAGEFLCNSFRHGSVICFSRADDSTNNIQIVAFNRYLGDENPPTNDIRVNYSIHYMDYMSIAFFAALAAATPLPLRRRILSLVLGLILLHVLVVSKLAVIILNRCNGRWFSLLMSNLFWNSTTSFVIAIFIWVAVSFRRKDWPAILTAKKNPLKNKERGLSFSKRA